MENFIKKEKIGFFIVGILFIFSILKSCESASAVKENNKRLDSLTKQVNLLRTSSVNKSELNEANAKLMYDFLIYEDDLDKKNMSMSELKEIVSTKYKSK